MKTIQTKQLRPVRVVLNTTNPKRHQWARIVDARTGERLHTGQLGYIRRVARQKFNVEATV